MTTTSIVLANTSITSHMYHFMRVFEMSLTAFQFPSLTNKLTPLQFQALFIDLQKMNTSHATPTVITATHGHTSNFPLIRRAAGGFNRGSKDSSDVSKADFYLSHLSLFQPL